MSVDLMKKQVTRINKIPLNTTDDLWYSWHLVLLSLPVVNV